VCFSEDLLRIIAELRRHLLAAGPSGFGRQPEGSELSKLSLRDALIREVAHPSRLQQAFRSGGERRLEKMATIIGVDSRVGGYPLERSLV